MSSVFLIGSCLRFSAWNEENCFLLITLSGDLAVERLGFWGTGQENN